MLAGFLTKPVSDMFIENSVCKDFECECKKCSFPDKLKLYCSNVNISIWFSMANQRLEIFMVTYPCMVSLL